MKIMKLLNSKKARLYYKISLICLISLLFFFSCKKSDFHQKFGFDDDRFHYVIYVDPYKDCLACILHGVNSLGQLTDAIDILAIQTGDIGDFANYIKTIHRNVHITAIKKPLSIGHPAVLLVKKNMIYAYVYLSANFKDMQTILNKIKDFVD